MSGRVNKELQMKNPITDARAEAMMNVILTAELVQDNMQQQLKPHGLTMPQYNVLRILRGAGEDCVSLQGIAERMVTQDSDITRLMDKLEKAGLAKRERCTEDRRRIFAVITQKGLESIRDAVEPLN